MPLELEAKMKVDDLAAVRRRLRECGATENGDLLEVNTFFDTPDRSLLKRDSGLRLRTASSLWQKQSRHVLTFKGPRQDRAFKARREIEFEVSDSALAREFLEALGFAVELSFEKRRQVWSLNDCEVVLDELPLLGTFVEIEGPSSDSIQAARAALQLADSPLINDSYIAMLVDYCRKHAITDRVIRF
jgi:adenylate cyclase class 2